VEPLPGYGVVPKICSNREEVLEFCSKLSLPVQERLTGYPWGTILEQPVREYWTHDGKCLCGKRTYLFGQCPACLRQEALDRGLEQDLSLERAANKPAEPAEDELAVDLVAALADVFDQAVVVLPTELILALAHTRDSVLPGFRGELRQGQWDRGTSLSLESSDQYRFRKVCALCPSSLSPGKTVVLLVQPSIQHKRVQSYELEAERWLELPSRIQWCDFQGSVNRFCEGQTSAVVESLLHQCCTTVESVYRWTHPEHRCPAEVLSSALSVSFYRTDESSQWSYLGGRPRYQTLGQYGVVVMNALDDSSRHV
jgi:hypothetical protein